jgi:nicotinate dehydrogenase subunit B
MKNNPPAPILSGPRIGDWFSVTTEGRLVVKTGRVELGQGNQTALLIMAADELGVPSEDLNIEMARTDRTVNEGYTAGSMSISEGGLALRYAASAMRQLLVEAAATRLGLDSATLDLRAGAISQGGVETGSTVYDLVCDVSFDMRVEDYAAPHAPDQRRHQFSTMDRIDLKDRIVGSPFVHDINEDGMLFGAPLHPPSMTSRLEEIDLDALLTCPGVVEVVRDGSFIGVIARTPFEAAKAVKFAQKIATWAETVISPNDPMESIAGSEADAPVVFSQGSEDNVEGTIYRVEVSRPFLMHASIGPSAGLAKWDNDKVTVWTHSQGVFQLRKAIAMALNTDEGKITVVHQPGAGCYGHNGADDAAFDAVLMARKVPGKLVKVVWSRQNEFQASPLGPGMVTIAEATLGSDGHIKQMNVDVNSAPHANRPSANGTPNLRAASYLAKPILSAPSTDLPLVRGGGADRNAVPGYDIPNIKVRKRLVHLPYRTSSLRALGAFNNVFAIESLIDDIASDCGEDPVSFRLRHLSDVRSRHVIEKVLESSEAARSLPKSDGIGWGFAYARYKNTSGYCAIFARVDLQEGVRVTDMYCAVDVGEVISLDGVRNQIEGGIVQSTSWTLKESAFFEGVSVQAESWLDYPILRFSEVPRVYIDVIERPELPPLGCGEVSQAPTAAAIGNAVKDALGVRVSSLPITRNSIIEAI